MFLIKRQIKQKEKKNSFTLKTTNVTLIIFFKTAFQKIIIKRKVILKMIKEKKIADKTISELL